MTAEPSVSLTPGVAQAIEAINQGSISWSTLAKFLGSDKAPEAPERPAKLPMPATITEAQRKALERLTEVFGSVVPVERRALQPAEVKALYEERTTLDQIGKLVESRKDNIRTTILNHFDVSKENFDTGPVGARIDKDGHYLSSDKDTQQIPGEDKVWSWETSQGSPSISPFKLKALADDASVPEVTHEDWLAMTQQTRVFDESRALAHIKKNPKLLAHISKAADPATPRGALYIR